MFLETSKQTGKGKSIDIRKPCGEKATEVLISAGIVGGHQSVVTRKAAYRDVVRWVKDTYGVHVKNIDISRAKQRCGLAHMELDRPASPGYKPDKESPDREALVIEAFRHFGMI